MTNSSLLSIIIPTLNEAVGLGDLLCYLKEILVDCSVEIIISDGGSQDKTLAIAQAHGCQVVKTQAGRAVQLNAGAAAARGDLFYFLHADSYPPKDLADYVQKFRASSFSGATFQLSFHPSTLLLRQSAYFTRFNCLAFRFGDASLLVKRSAYEAIDGYDESFLLMEDNDIIRRLKQHGSFGIYNAKVKTSSRKYLLYGDWYLQSVYVFIYILQRLGLSQQKLYGLYKWLLKNK